MSVRLQRRVADLLCRALQSILPPRMRDWGLAIRYEVAEIPEDNQALWFALESVRGLAPRAIGLLLMQPFVPLLEAVRASRAGAHSRFGALHSPRAVGALCAVGAVDTVVSTSSTALVPRSKARRSADSKSTRFAWYPGVSMLARLSVLAWR